MRSMQCIMLWRLQGTIPEVLARLCFADICNTEPIKHIAHGSNCLATYEGEQQVMTFVECR